MAGGERPLARLALADGTLLTGSAIGAAGVAVGELVFNTAMTGYQEILTDSSYSHQIVTLTYPHIGNTGVNEVDLEATVPMAAGLVVRDTPRVSSNYRATERLPAYLRRHGVVAIADVDTRYLTRRLRTEGTLHAAIGATSEISDEMLVRIAGQFGGLVGADLAKVVGIEQQRGWAASTYDLQAAAFAPTPASRFSVVVLDYGVKHNILRLLTERGCDITILPPQSSADEVMQHQPDGILLSNGPGDPAACDYAVAAAKTFISSGIPTFGICLGHQVLGLALGGHSEKMPFGHHGANHPVLDLATGRVMITSQNHGFALAETSLPDDVHVTHRSLFDGTLQGFAHDKQPVLAFQGHPEASPGPKDIEDLFDRFVTMMEAKRA